MNLYIFMLTIISEQNAKPKVKCVIRKNEEFYTTYTKKYDEEKLTL